MKRNKFIENGKPILEVRKTSEWLRYDICALDGRYMCSIYKYADGFSISLNMSKDKPIATAAREHFLGMQYGSYVGNVGKKRLEVDRNSIKIDNVVVAKHSGTNAGFVNAFISAYTYRMHYIEASDSITEENAIICVAIYAYLNYIR